MYDVVDEDQYKELVTGRRNGTDFVVDDSKCACAPTAV